MEAPLEETGVSKTRNGKRNETENMQCHICIPLGKPRPIQAHLDVVYGICRGLPSDKYTCVKQIYTIFV